MQSSQSAFVGSFHGYQLCALYIAGNPLQPSRRCLQDVLVIMQDPAVPMSFLRCKPIGLMPMVDSGCATHSLFSMPQAVDYLLARRRARDVHGHACSVGASSMHHSAESTVALQCCCHCHASLGQEKTKGLIYESNKLGVFSCLLWSALRQQSMLLTALLVQGER